jgi:hypothetical protein
MCHMNLLSHLKAIQFLTLRGWLHERFSACDLLQIADAIWCICDLDYDKNQFLSFFLHQIADAI